MMLSNIDIQIKGDHYWEPAEQEYHEALIDFFKTEFSNWLDNCGVRTSGVICFNLYYIPGTRKFYIAKISKKETELLQELKKSTKFYTKYFTHSFIGSADDE